MKSVYKNLLVGLAVLLAAAAVAYLPLTRSTTSETGEEPAAEVPAAAVADGVGRYDKDFSAWVSRMNPDRTWTEPTLVSKSWPLEMPTMIFYKGWVMYDAPPETLAMLNPQGPPPEDIVEMVQPLFDVVPHDGGQVLMAPDGRMTCYFTSERLGGEGMGDLFAMRHVDGAWTEPENLGPPINTPYDEVDLCFTEDARTMYFSSSRPGGLGEEDIYLSRWDEASGIWSEPEHQRAVNSPRNDFPWRVIVDGSLLLFGTEREGPETILRTHVHNQVSDIYIADRSADGRLGPGRPISGPINAGFFDDLLHISPHGPTLFIVSSRLLE